MTYRDILIMRMNLDQVNAIDGTNPKFIYAVSRNKARLDSIIKGINEIKKPSEDIEEFWRKFDETNKKHAETDESGTVQYTTIQLDGQEKKAFKKVIGEGNPESKYSKELAKLRDEYKDQLEKYEGQIKSYNKMLDEEVPADDFRKFMIDLEIVPAGLNPKAMDGCLPFIKEVEQDEEPVKEEKKVNSKKHN